LARPPAAIEDSRVLIEQAMYFALGFLAAGLVTLMLLPAFWRRAMRLSLRRLNMLTPLSIEKMTAERDLLRGELAVRYRRLEQQMEAVRGAKAQDMADIGRNAARIAVLDGKLTQALARGDDFEKKFIETKGFLDERTELLRATENALNDMTDRVETLIANLRNVEMDREELGRIQNVHRSQVATHESSIAGLHVQNAELRQRVDALQEQFARAAAEAERLEGVDAVLAQTTRELDSTIVETTELKKALDDARTRLAALERRSAMEVERLESALRVARAEESDHADRLEAARSDNALLQGTVEALRKERAHLREAASGHAAAAADAAQGDRDVLALRQAIVELGARMAEIAAQPTANSNEAAQSKRA
jgi:chromosome segregation ATPase